MVEHDRSIQVETEIQEKYAKQLNTSKTEAYAIQMEQKDMRNSTLDCSE